VRFYSNVPEILKIQYSMSKSNLLFFEINPGFREQPFMWDKCGWNT